ncbi:helicase-associated domain-containing protein [Micromonospora zhanjiangensis]|uniref:Helicase-associated domain-containing protein n=1 Tax=Micromonospora zhanjiangensis TaxID=1522057 RepID=A0ABV8KMX1_9ACTN
MASPLVRWLAGRTADELAAILARRADALGPTEPDDLADLATRLQSRASVTAALSALPRPALQLIEAVQASGGPTTSVERLAALLGRSSDDPELGATLAVLAGRALVWPDGVELRMAAPLWSAFPRPLGLGARAERLLAGLPADQLRAVARALTLPPARGRRDLLTGVCAALADGDRVRELVSAAPPAARTLLTELAHGEPLVAVPPGHRDRPADDAVGWATRRGLLIWDGWRHAQLPAEVGVALRGPDWRAPFDPEPPGWTLTDVPVEAVRREAAAAATAALDQAAALLGLVDAAPATTLKTGGVGTRELRRLARAAGCDEPRVRLWLELAYAAGLVGFADGQLRPTDRYDEWRAAEPADRLSTLLRVWPRLPAAPLADVRPDGTPAGAALSRDGTGLTVGDLRTALLRTIGDLPAGRGAGDDGELAAALSWQLPLLGGSEPDTRLAVLAGLAREARALGVVAHGALSTLGRALLADPGSLPATAAALLPRPLAGALFQNDLTAVVPGVPAAALADLLDAAAVRESRGGATGWRFTASSVRAALDAGHDPAGLTAALRAVVTGDALPQPLEYLIRDVGRQHGRVRVRAVGCVLRVDDPALGAELLRARSLGPLKLTELAPTVLASGRPVAETLRVLRDAGYPPVGEDAAGRPRIERPPRLRAPVPRRPAAPHRPAQPASPAGAAGAAGAAGTAGLVELAGRLLAGSAGPAGPPRTGPTASAGRPRTGPTELTGRSRTRPAEPVAGEAEALATVIRLPVGAAADPDDPLPVVHRHARQLQPDERRRLATAIDRGDPIKISYRDSAGDYTVRIVEPVCLDGRLLVAWCHLRADERNFALDRIESVAPA